MANRVLLGDDSIPGSAITVYVTVVSVGGANKFAIDGIVGANIELQNGTTYTFDQSDSSNSGHPFRVSNNIDGTINAWDTTNDALKGFRNGASTAFILQGMYLMWVRQEMQELIQDIPQQAQVLHTLFIIFVVVTQEWETMVN